MLFFIYYIFFVQLFSLEHTINHSINQTCKHVLIIRNSQLPTKLFCHMMVHLVVWFAVIVWHDGTLYVVWSFILRLLNFPLQSFVSAMRTSYVSMATGECVQRRPSTRPILITWHWYSSRVVTSWCIWSYRTIKCCILSKFSQDERQCHDI